MVAEDLTALLDAIESLLAEPPAQSPAAVARIEQTLTDGYARALELDAERWRLERRIADLARLLGAGDAGDARELSGLYERLADTDAKAKRLRDTLATLRRYAGAARGAQAPL